MATKPKKPKVRPAFRTAVKNVLNDHGELLTRLAKTERSEHIRETTARVMDAHAETLKKLAE